MTFADGHKVTYGPCSRPSSINRLWAGIIFVLDHGACAPKCGPGGTTGTGVSPLPTSGWTPGAIAETALLTGVVDGSATLDGGCVWLEQTAGGGSARVPVVWPHGYQVRFEPQIEILDSSGTVVAKSGQTIGVGGGLGPAGDRPCMFGHADVFYVQSAVQVVGGR